MDELEKNINNWKLLFFRKENTLEIKLYKKNSYDVFKFNFNKELIVKKFKQFLSNFEIKNIIRYICSLIDENKFNIKEKENELEFNLIPLNEEEKISLTLKKNDLLSDEVIEILINNLEELKYNNSDLNKIKENLNNEYTSDKEKSIFHGKDYEQLNDEMFEKKKLFDENEKNFFTLEEKMKEFENRIKILESFNS